MLKRIILIYILFLKLNGLFAQQNSFIDLTKERPPKYKNKVLRSEKTGDGKLKGIAKIYQNTVTHYNYVFNARETLKDMMAQAKKSYRDDYTKLLSFYNYDLKTLSQNKNLDSVIVKTNTGILKHDLRTSWVDALYQLMGEAYFYKNIFDSANIIFQYINYAFAPKDEGYDLPIGSNIANTNGELTVSSKESVNLWKRLSDHYPRRNDALLWIVRCNTEMEKYTLANGILQLLYNDKTFPDRLKPDLDEMMAYWFFKQKNYDSAVSYLEKCRDNVAGNERARRSFLIAQLYAATNQDSVAVANYMLCAKQTNDPVMEAYANLNSLDVAGKNNTQFAAERLKTLLNLAKKDKFIDSRDVIYYAAAQLQLKNNNLNDAKDLLKKSILANVETRNSRQLTLNKMLMGDIGYSTDSFSLAAQSYQPVNENALEQTEMRNRLALRKQPLINIDDKLKTIHVEDSLQTIAKMPEAERTALLKKTVRQIRKKFGLAEEQEFDNASNFAGRSDSTPADLFANNMVKGDWYFNNQSVKSMGYNAFKQKFGNRANADNWQRQSAAATARPAFNNSPNANKNLQIKKIDSLNITVADLEEGLPLTKEKMQESDDKISGALLSNGKTFQNSLENYPAAIASYNELLRRFPTHKNAPEALANLYTCYIMLHQNNKADSVRLALNAMGKENLLRISTEPAVTSNKSPAGKEYERIYNLFIEGKFAEARAAKAVADSTFGTTYWTPQLIYIEAIDFVTNRKDSIAIARLNFLLGKFPTSPIKPKAQNMINVLKNRKSIEDYLTKLQITPKGDTDETVHENIAVVEKKQPPPPAKDNIDTAKKEITKNIIPPPKTDSVTALKPVEKHIETIKKQDSATTIKQMNLPPMDSSAKQIAINKTEPHIPAKPADTAVAIRTDENKPVKPTDMNISSTKKDSTHIAALPVLPDTSKPTAGLNIQQPEMPKIDKPKTDSALAKKENSAVKPSAPEIDALTKTKVSDSTFTIDPKAPQYVMILLNNVVYVFSNEARNAFEIYNSQTFTNMNIPIFSEKINEAHNAILMGPFGDAVLAMDYIQKVKGVTKNIVPWLEESRYSFVIISAKNMELLRKGKKLDEYLQLLHKAMPERF
ncbi:MAG: hypothetical protein LBE82_00665 [Chitinophagaceae bacterium]|jgi:outer membrane protein assembly factor BamD (BamD/ComL family)|nr:hypothetical protein [Chitinophagaceae bacterium]